MPDSLFARTSSSCWPGSTFSIRCGVSQDPNDSPSSEHSNVASGSFEENVKLALTFTDDAGGPVRMVVSGGVTVQRWRTGLASKLPSELRARIRSSCWPGSRPSITYGVSHEPQASGSSSAHSKSAVTSLEENSNVAVELGLGLCGPDSSVVSGTTSTEPSAIANGDSESTSAHAVPLTESVLSVTSSHSVPSWCSTRTGMSYSAGL